MREPGSAPPAFLDRLPAAEREALLRAGHPRRWARGDLLTRAGDPAESAIILRSGRVKIHKPGTDGEEVVLGILGPGDLMGEMVAVRAAVRTASASALEPIEGTVISVAGLRGFLAAHPASALALLDLALGRLHIADARRLEYATAGSLGRVASRLVELAERFGTPGTGGSLVVDLPINQEELASWSASSKESTARALRSLRDLKLIETSRRRLVVLDLRRLRAHAPSL